MGLFHREVTDPETAPTVPKSEADTPVSSESESAADFEKKPIDEKHVEVPPSTSSSDESKTGVEAPEKTAAETTVEDGAALEPTRSRRSLTKLRTRSSSFNPMPDVDDEIEYPTGLKLFLIMLSLCLAVFLMALDNTIIATAIPKITDQFNSLGDVGWYGSAYLLTTCALQLFFGKLYTFYSIKWVFLSSIFIFEIGSAICGSAPSSEALIVGRAVAGIGSAGLFAGALVIIAYTVPLAKRPIYTGAVGAMYGIASVAGPLLGGAFTDGPGWDWCFYINLPLGAITIVVIFFFFQSPKRKLEEKVPLTERARQLDLGGTFVFIIAIVCVLLALQWGGSKYPWSNWRVIVCLAVFGFLLIIFIGIQWYMGEYATIPFNIIKQRSVAASCAWAAFLGGGFFVMIYWIPIWFQAIKGASALRSGIMCLPMIMSLVFANIFAGIGTTIVGYYNPFFYASVVFMSVGTGLITTWNVHTGAGMWIGYQIIYGLGVGFGMQNAIITVQAVLPLKDIPTGTAMVSFFQTFGGALLVSVAQNVFNNRLISEIPKEAPGIDPRIILHVGATSLAKQIPSQFLHGVQTAYNTALTNTWFIAVAMSCLTVIPAALVEWKSIKGMKPGAAAAAA